MKSKKQNPKFRKLKKPRVKNGLEVEQYLQDYNTYSTMYKENFCKNLEQQNKKKRTSRAAKKPKKPSKVKFSGNGSQSMEGVLSVVSLTKSQLNATPAQDKPAPSPHSRNSRNGKGTLQKTNSRIELVNTMTKRELRETKLDEPNTLGRVETWLDPADAIKNPVHSRVIVKAKPEKFLKKNLKTLIYLKNEYYPYLGGKCMCGTCVCGQCRCVHFKFNGKGGQGQEYKTIYQQDFVPWKMKPRRQHKMKPELQIHPHQKNMLSDYQMKFVDPHSANYNPNQIKFENKAMSNNIDPFQGKIKKPSAKETSYQLDYPNWETSNKQEMIQPYVPSTRSNKLPFFGRCVNAEYGDFYKKNQVPEIVKAKNLNFVGDNPLGPSIPIDYGTSQNKEFIRFPKDTLEPLEKHIPDPNILTDKTPFMNQFKPTSHDHDNKHRKVLCPLKLATDRIKGLLKDYAKTHKIPY